jgi:hypothetical protein
MGDEVTISRPDVVAMIEEAAARLTGGDETEAVALAVRRLLASDTRSGTLFGRQPGSVRVREAVDLTAPAFDEPTDEETGCELEHCYNSTIAHASGQPGW